MNSHRLFTSESVSPGHPDKICDQISDAILDALLAQDPHSRVACETLVTTGLVVLAGEITTKARVDYQQIARDTVRAIGYTDSAIGFDHKSCAVLMSLGTQSPDISQGVTEGQGLHGEQGAGDQGLMFGYACNETPERMPLPISLAHKLMAEHVRLREAGTLPYLRPDAKSQVTVEYDADMKPLRVHTVVLSTQHTEDVEHKTIYKDVVEKLIPRAIPSRLLDARTIYHINPTGRFVVGGPHGDSGLTGRKIIVDTYGGMGRHGGGAFSGKDPSKVDRSACYAARWVAKNIVAADLAARCEVQLSYAIGIAKPLSIHVETFGTGKVDDATLVELISRNFDLTPRGIIASLDLLKPIYQRTARNGHFGHAEFPWEQTNKVAALRQALEVHS